MTGYDIREALLEEGDVILAGRYTLRAIWTPGHTPGHFCFEVYADWKLRLAYDKLEPEELEYGRLEAEYRGLLAEWKMSETYWTLEQGIPDAVAADEQTQVLMDRLFRYRKGRRTNGSRGS